MSDTPSTGNRLLTHGIALVLGAALGVGGLRTLEYLENPELMDRPEGDLSRAQLIAKLDDAQKQRADVATQLEAKSAEVVATTTKLQEAGERVTTLEGQVENKEGEIKVLELKVKKSAGKSAALAKELEERKAELETLKEQLDTALAEKAQLERDLTASRAETENAREETQEARRETADAQDDAVNAKWAAFAATAQVDICEKGSRSKLAKCKEAVTTALSGERAARFKQCVGSGQAQPRLVKVDPKAKDVELPRWGEWFDEESKFTAKKWYLVFCDPTLPESRAIGGSRSRALEDVPDLDEEL